MSHRHEAGPGWFINYENKVTGATHKIRVGTILGLKSVSIIRVRLALGEA
jgi:hypothetical protein